MRHFPRHAQVLTEIDQRSVEVKDNHLHMIIFAIATIGYPYYLKGVGHSLSTPDLETKHGV